ncbi:50S ribosomal protein L6P [Aeropyrum pernix K1]|uniref:Large ribosomal subunit protein uL6 n=1 Tax=Aeropyrum pernix (strain ATCC 700893 / DSM 11879 / JCM 9820 / NBRC 100138 / K1) TaxID=272557 RepID=RL6_AERPE|nr:50S ribosomal protein L6 [Aeropyrum pernix]Q9YF91.1 RecName: Full=Large ribosomal subunit protein uL6; AltName: Full=50S ribosomal protein L6 [Aeropyrum pernix K1]BAA79305.1 50S ribosomal protein L6P [Aeropyrum pernix K1]
MAKDVHVVERVEVPEGVTVSIDGMRVKVSGPKGEVERDFSHARGVLIRLEDNSVVVESFFAKARQRALVGAIAGHIRNMIKGVQGGFRYKLKIMYSHFPINVKVEGDKFIISNFLGEKGLRIARIMPGVKVQVKGSDVIVEGIDVEKVAQTAANIELATKVKDKDRRKFMDGIYIYEREVIA